MYRQWVAELRFVSALGLEWVDGVQGGGHYLFVDGRWKGAAGSHTGTRTRRRRAVVGERIAAQRAGWLGWAGLDGRFVSMRPRRSRLSTRLLPSSHSFKKY